MSERGDGPRRVAVVGGGITGLSAAYRLQQRAREAGAPLQVDLFEKSAGLGGKVRSVREDDLLLEAGPDSFLASRPALAELCGELGLADELVPPGEGEETGSFIRVGHRLIPIPPGFSLSSRLRWGPILRSPLLSWRGKLRMALEPFIPPRRSDEDESLADFARRRVGVEAATRLLEPLLARIYSADPTRLSMQAAYPWLLGMERRYGSLYAAMRRSNRRESGRHLLTHPEGLGRIVERLVEASPSVRFRRGHEVTELQRDGQGYRLVLADGTVERVDGVVLATPASAAARILRNAARDVAQVIGAIRYAAVASVYVAFPRSAVAHPLRGSGYLAESGAKTPIKACTWVTSKWPHADRRGERVLLRCHVSSPDDRRPTEWDDATLLKYVREELAATLEIVAPPSAHWIFRWPEAIPQYEVGHAERVARIEAWERTQPALAIAGAALRGSGLAACTAQGLAAADRVWAGLQAGAG